MAGHRPDRAQLGGRLGPRLADLTARAMSSHLRSSMWTRAQIHKAGLDSFWHGVGDEYRGVLGPQLKRWAEHEEMPEELRPLFHFLATQPGEGAGMLSTIYYGTGLGQTIGAILSNALAPLIHFDLSNNPNSLIPPDLAAVLAAKHIWGIDPAGAEAAGGAINGPRFQAMVENATVYPDPAMALDLWRRGHYTDAETVKALHRAGLADEAIAAMVHLKWVPLQAADLADMTLRGIIDQATGRAKAREVGVPESDFDLLAEAQGEPPGPDQLVEAFRRGFIDQQRLTRGIRQSRVRNEWIDVEIKLGHQPMDTSDAVAAVVQGHLSDGEGRRVAELNGLESQYWPVMVQTAGQPIARGEALELYNRGELSQAAVEQAIRESHVKNKYIPDILKLHRRIPPERTVISMLAHGAIDHERALRLLMDLGFDKQIAESLVLTGTRQRTGATRHLALGTVTELYADGAIDQAEALAAIKELGYTDHDAHLELRVAELRREASFRRSAATRVGTDYVDRLIDRGTVISYLDRIGLPGEQRDRLLELWDLERDARRRRLTEAQIHSAFHKGAILQADAHARLVAMGYDDADATLLLEI